MVVRNEWRKRASGGGIRLACDERTGLVRSVAIMQVRTLTDHPSAHFDGSFIHSTIHLCLFPQMNPIRRRTMPSKNAEIALLPGIWPQYGMLGTAEINYSTWKSDLTILTWAFHPILGPYSWQDCDFCILGRDNVSSDRLRLFGIHSFFPTIVCISMF